MRNCDGGRVFSCHVGKNRRQAQQKVACALTAFRTKVYSGAGKQKGVRAVARQNLLARQPFPFTPMMFTEPLIDGDV